MKNPLLLLLAFCLAYLPGSAQNITENLDQLFTPYKVSGGVITNTGDSGFTMTAGTILLRNKNEATATQNYYRFSAVSYTAVSNNTTRYIIATASTNSIKLATVAAETSDVSNGNNKLLLGIVRNASNTITVYAAADYGIMKEFNMGTDSVANFSSSNYADTYFITSTNSTQLFKTANNLKPNKTYRFYIWPGKTITFTDADNLEMKGGTSFAGVGNNADWVELRTNYNASVIYEVNKANY